MKLVRSRVVAKATYHPLLLSLAKDDKHVGGAGKADNKKGWNDRSQFTIRFNGANALPVRSESLLTSFASVVDKLFSPFIEPAQSTSSL